MTFGPGTYLLGYLAGALSTLSPCVLPLLPILIATALARHRFGPLALAAGLTLSFAAVGLLVATLGMSIGLDAGALRRSSGGLLLVFGIVLLVPALQQRFAAAVSRLGASVGGPSAQVSTPGWSGQFAAGLVLGWVWSPCVGPTLGTAGTLAAQGSHLGQVMALMLLFGLGASTPLLLIGALSQAGLARMQGALRAAGQHGKWLFGAWLAGMGLLMSTGLDKRFETWLVELSPPWLIELTTRF